MIFLKLLLINGLIFYAVAAVFADERSFKLLDYIIPQHYNIKMVPHATPYKQNIYYGECGVSIKILRSTRTINLHSNVQCITDVELTDNPPRFQQYGNKEMIIYKPIKHLYDNKTYIVEFSFMNELSSGRYILNMKFVGVITADRGDGNSLIESENKEWAPATHFQPINARRLFPCWDKPELKATFNISLILHRDFRAFSNRPVREMKELEHDMSWINFYDTPAISSYLVTVFVTRADLFIDLSKVGSFNEQHVFHPLDYANKIIINITRYLKNEWERSVKIPTDHIAVIHSEDEYMVNVGLVLYRTFDIVYDKDLDSIGNKIKMLRLIVYKEIRQWFSPQWYYLWLNEAFATFFGAYIIDKTISDSRMMDLFVVQIQQDCLHLDANYSMLPPNLRINRTSEIPYHFRASVILHMLQHTVGEEAFWNGIQIYIYSRAFKWTTTHDFWTAIQTAFNEMPHFCLGEINIMKHMDPWFKQEHYPVLRVIQNPGGFKNITLKVLHTSKNWSIPLTYTTQAHPNFNITMPGIWLNMSDLGTQVHILDISNLIYGELKDDEWIIFNLKRAGYYRVNYDIKNWQKISNYLNFDNYTNIHVLNRAQLIDDAFHFMITRQLNSSIFWNLVNYLSRETDYVAWYPMFKALEYMSCFIPLSDKRANILKAKMQNIFKELYIKTTKNVQKDDLEKCLKEETAKWACFFNDPLCKEDASKKIRNYFHPYPVYDYRLVPRWEEWTHCRGLATDITWMEMYELCEQLADVKLLKFLACSKNSHNIRNLLVLIIKLQLIIHPADDISKLILMESYLFTIARHANNDDTLEYILNYFDTSKPRELNTIVSLSVIINNVYSQQNLQKIILFLEDNAYKARVSNPSTSTELDYEEAEISNIWIEIENHASLLISKLHLRSNKIKTQKDYLHEFGPKNSNKKK